MSTAHTPDAATEQLLLTPREAAEALAISERTLWGLTQPRGSIPCIRLGRAVRYSTDDLRRWIEEQSQCSGADGGPAT